MKTDANLPRVESNATNHAPHLPRTRQILLLLKGPPSWGEGLTFSLAQAPPPSPFYKNHENQKNQSKNCAKTNLPNGFFD